MSKADGMFEKLGYKKYLDSNDNIEFYKYEDGLLRNDTLILIRFYAKHKKVWKNEEMSMEELQAINEKVKELEWNE